MKKLICAKEVEGAAARGEAVICIDAQTIITPAARDAAQAAGISFAQASAEAAQSTPPAQAKTGLESDLIYKALEILMEKGMITKLMETLGVDVPYVSESDEEGMVKLVRANTAKYEPLDTGKAGDKVYYNELISASDGAQMNAGFMTIEQTSFAWDVACQEIYYIVEGSLTVQKDGRVFSAGAGDCLFFKRGAKLIFGTTDKVKVFYATH